MALASKPQKTLTLFSCIPGSIAQQYYRHGLFCASQPLPVLVFAIIGILWACFPLLTIQVYSGSAKVWAEDHNVDTTDKPRWLDKPPLAYVQQIIMKAAVHPYTEEMILTDAFRGPLASSFKLHLGDILGFYDKETGLDMDHECMRTDGLSPRYRASLSHILPDYGCLILSPANIWKKDPITFQDDGNVVSTVFNFQSLREGHSSLADIMFGLKQRDTGLTKYPVRNRQRTITYAVTVVLRQHKQNFIAALRRQLGNSYPLNADLNSKQPNSRITHIHFPEQINGAEYIPYAALIVFLFFYMLFSCRKIDLIQSKVGISLTAIITILGSLFMSLGLSGQTLGGTGYVYLVPYAVAFISLENVLVITRSIVSTPAHLDVKIRVAQGLSKEGWNITKNLFSQITLLTFGFFIGVVDSSIQDFCLFAVMGVLSDFYLQHFFFITVLSMDISRTGLVDILQNTSSKRHVFQHPVAGPGVKIPPEGCSPTGLFAPSLDLPPKKVPRRVQVVNFWAQRRVVSRIFLVTMVVWIMLFIHKARLLEMIIHRGSGWFPSQSKEKEGSMFPMDSVKFPGGPLGPAPENEEQSQSTQSSITTAARADNISNILSAHPAHGFKKVDSLTKLQHKNLEYWKRLPYSHWPMLFGVYNMSVYGSYLSLLPPITLSMIISPEAAMQLRSPNEENNVKNQPVWTLDKIRSALEMGDDDDEDLDDVDLVDDGPELSPFVPTSPGELVLAFTLSIPSILFLIYLCVVCYRFICTKNYAEWRSGKGENSSNSYTQIVQEGVPVPLIGHKQDIETVITCGHLILSYCLAGQICVWDSLTGECLTTINRKEEQHHAQNNRGEGDKSVSGGEGDEGSPSTSVGSAAGQFSELNALSSEIFKDHLRLRIPKPNQNINQSETYRKFAQKFKLQDNSNKSFKAQLDEIADSYKAEAAQTKKRKRTRSQKEIKPAVWSLDLADGLVVVGCDNGSIEVWDALTGELSVSYQDTRRGPINIVKLINYRLIVVRLDGHIDFFDLTTTSGIASLSDFSDFNRMRSYSSTSMDNDSVYSLESYNLSWRLSVKAHVQSITCIAVQGSRLITGSQDHTLRVFRVEDGVGVYTLHGHSGPITAVFIDRCDHSAAGSASQDGIMCVWDLLSGACMYSIQAHDGSVLSLVYSPSYVVSYGTDGKVCVWERFQGHLINSINTNCVGDSISSTDGDPQDLVMLTHNLIVTGRPGCLLVWDVRLPDPVKIIRLGKGDTSENVRVIRQVGDTIVCSFGNSLRLIRFPMLMDKQD